MGGKLAKGITGAFMIPIIRKLHAKARQVMGPGAIHLILDRATCFKERTFKAEAKRLFISVVVNPPKSPDLISNDAGLHHFLEKQCREAAAVTLPEIRRNAKRAWRTLTSETCKRLNKRVRRNMEECIRLKGGNFYHE